MKYTKEMRERIKFVLNNILVEMKIRTKKNQHNIAIRVVTSLKIEIIIFVLFYVLVQIFLSWHSFVRFVLFYKQSQWKSCFCLHFLLTCTFIKAITKAYEENLLYCTWIYFLNKFWRSETRFVLQVPSLS